MLWNDFLQMMKQKNDDDTLTLDQLREAVKTEHTKKEKEKRIQEEIQAAEEVSSTMHVAKRAKIEDDTTFTAMDYTNMNTVQNTKISAEAVQSIASSLMDTTDNIFDSAALKAEWLARDGNAMPTRPEPPLFSPSPPKLGDPSGKDLLGTALALKLIRLLMNKSMDGERKMTDISGSAILGIVNGCWMMTALKEKEAATSQDTLDKKLVSSSDAVHL